MKFSKNTFYNNGRVLTDGNTSLKHVIMIISCSGIIPFPISFKWPQKINIFLLLPSTPMITTMIGLKWTARACMWSHPLQFLSGRIVSVRYEKLIYSSGIIFAQRKAATMKSSHQFSQASYPETNTVQYVFVIVIFWVNVHDRCWRLLMKSQRRLQIRKGMARLSWLCWQWLFL